MKTRIGTFVVRLQLSLDVTSCGIVCSFKPREFSMWGPFVDFSVCYEPAPNVRPPEIRTTPSIARTLYDKHVREMGAVGPFSYVHPSGARVTVQPEMISHYPPTNGVKQ